MRLGCICKTTHFSSSWRQCQARRLRPLPPHLAHSYRRTTPDDLSVDRGSRILKPRWNLRTVEASEWLVAGCISQWSARLTHCITLCRRAWVLHLKLLMRHGDPLILFADSQSHNKPIRKPLVHVRPAWLPKWFRIFVTAQFI